MLCDDLQLLCLPKALNKELDDVVKIGLKSGKFNKPTVILLEKDNGKGEILVYGRMVKE